MWDFICYSSRIENDLKHTYAVFIEHRRYLDRESLFYNTLNIFRCDKLGLYLQCIVRYCVQGRHPTIGAPRLVRDVLSFVRRDASARQFLIIARGRAEACSGANKFRVSSHCFSKRNRDNWEIRNATLMNE